MNILRKSFVCLILLLILPSFLWAWTGKVVGVSDGDTITVLHNGRGEKIRLYGIDTPEKRQDFGKRAKQFTSGMVFGKIVEIEPKDVDRYGRTVGLVYVNGESLNKALIKNGFAWVYRKYCKEVFCKDWFDFEKAAKYGKIGLWAGQNPIPPWEFRHKKTGNSYNREPVSKKSLESRSVTYHGNFKSKVFHAPGCRYYNCKLLGYLENPENDFPNRVYINLLWGKKTPSPPFFMEGKNLFVII